MTAVPFALLGVVQLLAVAGWLGLAGASTFPRLRRPVTPLFALGALGMAAADALTAVDFGSASSPGIGWLRLGALALVVLGVGGGAGQSLVLQLPTAAVAGVVVPLGTAPTPAYVAGAVGLVGAGAAWQRGRRPTADAVLGATLAAGLALTGIAAALADPARHSSNAALAELSVRAAATVVITVALIRLARTSLLGKLTGAILAGVVAMAAGAVGVVGSGVANEVQAEQSQRLLQVAQGVRQTFSTLGTRVTIYAQVIASCAELQKNCTSFLTTLSDQPAYFGAIVQPSTSKDGGAAIIASHGMTLSNTALVQLAGSPIVRAALAANARPGQPSGGALLLPGSPPMLVLVEAVPGRPAAAANDARVKPTFAGVYAVGVVDSYLRALSAQIGYDVSIVAGGQVVASSLGRSAPRAAVATEARSVRVDALDATVDRVVPAEGSSPTAAFAAVTQAGNDDVRIATVAISQPANEALRAQRSVLQRMFVTALVAMLLVVVLALTLARRIADPIRRLTVAAGRVRRGDLEATTSVTGRDEVGLLARAFDAMTASLRTATSELRDAAAQEAALRARLETVVESMSDGLVVVDGSGRIGSINAAAAALTRVAPEDAAGRRLREVLDIVDGDDRSLLDSTRDGRTVEGRLTSSAGADVPVRYSAAPLADQPGRVIVLADRTREVDVERIKSEFLANVSHELRTPLTPIRGYAEILARRSDLTKAQSSEFIDAILSATGRMSRVVELLVDVAALEAGRVASDVGKVSVRALVDERLSAWKSAYPDRAGDIRRRIGSRLPAVAIDARLIARALDEFADNAMKYTPAGTTVTLTAALTDDERHVRIAVRDTGPGFDPRLAAALVGDFSQADASETRRVGGMGLGLGFVSRVAARFGLDFTVNAEERKGAEFALLLPLWTGAEPAAPARPKPRKRAAR